MTQPTNGPGPDAAWRHPQVQTTLTPAGGDADENERVMETIFGAARVEAVFSEPVVAGPYTVITASEVRAGGGFGYGRGYSSAPDAAAEATAATGGGSGGGGGGASLGRPVAVIIIGPDGVRVEPVVDVVRLGTAAIGLWVRVVGLIAKAIRGKHG